MDTQEKNFVAGINLQEPTQEWVKASWGVNIKSFGEWMAKQIKDDPNLEWINLEVCKSGRNGKLYMHRVMPKQDKQPARQPANAMPWE